MINVILNNQTLKIMEPKVEFSRFGAHAEGMKSKTFYIPVLRIIDEWGKYQRYPIPYPEIDLTRKNYIGTIQILNDFALVVTRENLYSFDVTDGSLIAAKKISEEDQMDGVEVIDQQVVLTCGNVRKPIDRELKVGTPFTVEDEES